MNNTINELTEVLKGVNRSYDDFVRGILILVKDDEENQKKILDFIKSQDSVTTSEVIKYAGQLGLI